LLAKVMPKDNNTRDFSYLSCQDAWAEKILPFFFPTSLKKWPKR
jgi:hypothetical protein